MEHFFMERIPWARLARSWWGRSLIGAFLGGIIVAFAGLDTPAVFLAGMLIGAVVMYFLGRWE
jgi:hypothetical protein